jgi:septum formation inhibitor MinC
MAHIQNLEDTLNQTSELLESLKIEKNNLAKELQKSNDTNSVLKSEIMELQSQLRMVQREVTNKSAIIRSYERAMNLEKEKAAESEDRLRASLKEKAHLLSSDRAQELEKQVEQLNNTNRRILELNKTVMEENRSLKEQIMKMGINIQSIPVSSPKEKFTPSNSPKHSPSKKSHSTPASPRQSSNSQRKRGSSSLVLGQTKISPEGRGRPATPIGIRLSPETPQTPDSIPTLKSKIREVDLNLNTP